ncbi:site-specific integrase [Gammaproteobacteria bacterium]|jgi:integrase/recombinase XerD|nr:site-specific integrase [Gammaproteobacteria bacterium]
MSKQAKVLNNAEIKRLKAVINDNRYAVRNMTLMLLGLNIGLRAKELASLKVSDVLTDDFKIRDMCVLAKEQTKRDEANRIFFNKAIRKQLATYLNDDAFKHLQHRRDSTLFITKNNTAFTTNTLVNLFAQLFKLANIQQASTHSFRRTFATVLNDNATNVFTIQKLMRHKNIATTMLYVNVTDTQLINATNNLKLG